MSDFQWIGNNSILYKGRVCPVTENDEWGVVNAMERVDREEKRIREEIKAEIISELKGEQE